MRAQIALPAAACWLAVTAIATGRAQAPPPAPSGASASAAHQKTLGSYCVTCHNERLRTGGLSFDRFDMSDVGGQADVWEKVLLKLRMGAMPPPGRPRPDQPELDAFVSWLEGELDTSATRHVNPGRTGSVHRLNRSEYQNAIRDLLGLEIDVEPLLPVDDADKNGFDNVASMLSMSPTLLDRYLAAASQAQPARPRHPTGGTGHRHL